MSQVGQWYETGNWLNLNEIFLTLCNLHNIYIQIQLHFLTLNIFANCFLILNEAKVVLQFLEFIHLVK